MTTKNTKQEKTSVKLIELYLQSEEVSNQEEKQLQVEQAELQLKSDFLTTQQALSKAKLEYNAVLKVIPFDTSNILEAKQKIEALEMGLKEMAELKEQLF